MTTASPRPSPTQERFSLTRDEVANFHRDGFLGPYAACAPEAMDEIRGQLDREVFTRKGPAGTTEQCRHLDSALVWELCRSSAIVDRVVSLLGDDVVLWRSNFFDKGPGAKEVPWHQDVNYWPIVPDLNVSAWLAITEANVENSCVQVIPGSHRSVVPHKKVTGDKMFGEEADLSCVDTSKAIHMELKPGEFFLFTEKLLHFSEPNRSNKRRCGLAIRMTVPFVKVEHEKLFAKHKNLMLHGADRMGFNLIAEPPAE